MGILYSKVLFEIHINNTDTKPGSFDQIHLMLVCGVFCAATFPSRGLSTTHLFVLMAQTENVKAAKFSQHEEEQTFT